jgi:alpha-N-acetylglucosamine transferase
MKDIGLISSDQVRLASDLIDFIEKTSSKAALNEFKTVSMNTRKAYQSDLTYIRLWGYVSFENFSFPMTEHTVLL